MIAAFNRWYDDIREPWRLLIALSIISPVFVLMAMDSIALIAGGFVYATFLVFVRAMGQRK
jgi:predicted signal transduction protein with EAL and GGDEF domain